MRLMLVHRSRFDHGFNPQNAAEAALSRVAKITAGPRAPNPHRRPPGAMRAQINPGYGNPWPVDAARARTHLDRSA